MHGGVYSAAPWRGWRRHPRGRRGCPGLGLRYRKQLGPRRTCRVSSIQRRQNSCPPRLKVTVCPHIRPGKKPGQRPLYHTLHPSASPARGECMRLIRSPRSCHESLRFRRGAVDLWTQRESILSASCRCVLQPLVGIEVFYDRGSP